MIAHNGAPLLFSLDGALWLTPNNVVPPIITPPAGYPMPTRPAQPAEVSGCAGPAVDQPQPGRAKKSTKKGAKKDTARTSAAKGAIEAETSEKNERGWPSGVSEQDEPPPAVPGAWPSGISEK